LLTTEAAPNGGRYDRGVGSKALVAAFAGALAITAAAPATVADRAALRVTDLAPFTVSGSHFQPNERVELLVRTRTTRRTRIVKATAQGSFRTVFRRVRMRACRPYFVYAAGSLGSRAGAKSPLAQCGAPPGP
jgi:hypothetical protein